MEELKSYDDNKLKVIVYDSMSEIEKFQNIIRTINQELLRRKENPPIKAEIPPKKS